MCSLESKPLFRDLNADDPDPEVTRVESMCMNCHANGETRLLLTRIPYYKNVVLMSFSCEECGFENNEIQPGGAHAEMGVRFTLKVMTEKDLNRQLVKSDYASIKIPEVDLEIPPKSQKGEVTTVEGILLRTINGLSQEQATRRVEHPEAAKQLDEYIAKLINLKSMKDGGFTLILEDISEIPHFKEVVIMATVCDACGHKTNEVKSGGGIEERGVRFEVRVASKDDFSRDVLTSETCSISIPELDLEVGGRALGGRFTTAEGLLQALRQQVCDAPAVCGDAVRDSVAREMDKFMSKLDDILAGKAAVTLILDDPAGNSYVQSLNDDDPTLPDAGLKVSRYERSHEQKEELGLNDMKTEGYEQET